ncbi:MAG: DUF1592 domain-containing protein [Verrucomicrobia bacterium]|nr:DUF1592 domain-containing protein [Verrucomicrobiota bacterium]
MFPPVPRLGSLRVALALGCGATLTRADAAEVPTDPRTAAKQTFDQKVVPFLTTYCAGCHEKKQKGGVTFMYAKRDPGSPAFRSIWKTALSNLESEAMPPEDERQPTPEERAMFAAWVTGLKFMSPKDPGAFVIRRLNKTEYGNTLRDLFGADPALANSLPDEGSGAGYLNSLSPVLMEQYLGIANEVLDAVLAPEGRPPTAIQSSLQAPGQSLRRIATSLARRAYRRPPSEREVDVLLQVHALAKNQGRSDPEALRLLLKAVLVSPQFLFITPAPHTGTEPLPEIVPLDDHQLASRLSYFLWATMPDDELSALADAGKLRDPEALRAQVRRMLADPRSRALFDGFGAQWLGVDKLATKTFDAGKYPEMTPVLREAMYDEARLFFADIVRENRGLTTFIEADFSYLNQTVAAIYGLDQTVTGSAMRKVRFTDSNRGGILGMPGILATTSFPNRTSPVNRGVWVLEQVLGQHVPPAPANVPSLEKQDRKKIAGLTLRQRTELHRTDPVCANCHKILDPIGFGLENFDAIGRWRDADEAGGTIDPTGELPGNQRFTTPHELKRILARRSDDLCRNLTEKMLAHALCRPLEGYDEVVVDDLSKVIKADGYRMQTLISAIVTSYPFTHRRTKE